MSRRVQVKYEPTGDTELAKHGDASVVTLNFGRRVHCTMSCRFRIPILYRVLHLFSCTEVTDDCFDIVTFAEIMCDGTALDHIESDIIMAYKGRCTVNAGCAVS